MVNAWYAILYVITHLKLWFFLLLNSYWQFSKKIFFKGLLVKKSCSKHFKRTWRFFIGSSQVITGKRNPQPNKGKFQIKLNSLHLFVEFQYFPFRNIFYHHTIILCVLCDNVWFFKLWRLILVFYDCIQICSWFLLFNIYVFYRNLMRSIVQVLSAPLPHGLEGTGWCGEIYMSLKVRDSIVLLIVTFWIHCYHYHFHHYNYHDIHYSQYQHHNFQ